MECIVDLGLGSPCTPGGRVRDSLGGASSSSILDFVPWGYLFQMCASSSSPWGSGMVLVVVGSGLVQPPPFSQGGGGEVWHPASAEAWSLLHFRIGVFDLSVPPLLPSGLFVLLIHWGTPDACFPCCSSISPGGITLQHPLVLGAPCCSSSI